MPTISCPNCGGHVPADTRFCPVCGVRVDVTATGTAIEEVPTEESGPVPVHVTRAAPRYFGRAPRLLGSASRVAIGAVRARTEAAADLVAAQASAHRQLFRLRRELARVIRARAETMRVLGEAVYGGDEEATATARSRAAELDSLAAAKETEMAQIVEAAMERMQRAQLQVQPTEVMEEPLPAPVPEPAPIPSEPAEPAHVPEPTPVPSPAPGPVHVPEPAPGPIPEPPRPPE